MEDTGDLLYFDGQALIGQRPRKPIRGRWSTEHLLAEDYRPLREDVRSAIARYAEELDSLLDVSAAETDETGDEDDETDIVAVPLAELGRG